MVKTVLAIGSTDKLVVVAPRITVVIEIFDKRWLTRRGAIQFIGQSVAVGVPVSGGIQREGVWSSRACPRSGCFRAVADTITIGISVGRIRALRDSKLIDVQQTVAVHVGIGQIADTVTVQIVGWHGGSVQGFRTTIEFGNIAVTIVVVIKILLEIADIIGRKFVWKTVPIGVKGHGWVVRERIGSANAHGSRLV